MFDKFGFCKWETFCMNIHYSETCLLDVCENISRCQKRHPRPCKFIERGYCNHGDSCRFDHRPSRYLRRASAPLDPQQPKVSVNKPNVPQSTLIKATTRQNVPESTATTQEDVTNNRPKETPSTTLSEVSSKAPVSSGTSNGSPSTSESNSLSSNSTKAPLSSSAVQTSQTASTNAPPSSAASSSGPSELNRIPPASASNNTNCESVGSEILTPNLRETVSSKLSRPFPDNTILDLKITLSRLCSSKINRELLATLIVVRGNLNSVLNLLTKNEWMKLRLHIYIAIKKISIFNETGLLKEKTVEILLQIKKIINYNLSIRDPSAVRQNVPSRQTVSPTLEETSVPPPITTSGRANTSPPPTQTPAEKPSTSSASESQSTDGNNHFDLENIFNFIEMLKILDEGYWNMDFVKTLERTKKELKAILDFIPTDEMILRHKELDEWLIKNPSLENDGEVKKSIIEKIEQIKKIVNDHTENLQQKESQKVLTKTGKGRPSCPICSKGFKLALKRHSVCRGCDLIIHDRCVQGGVVRSPGADTNMILCYKCQQSEAISSSNKKLESIALREKEMKLIRLEEDLKDLNSNLINFRLGSLNPTSEQNNYINCQAS